MRYFITLVPLFHIFAAALPALTRLEDVTPTHNLTKVKERSLRLVGFEKCSRDQERFIYEAWDEFEKMVPLGDPEDPHENIEYPWLDWKSAPALDFFGPVNRVNDYRSRVKANLDRLASVRKGFWTFWTMHLRCDDPSKKCSCDPCKDSNCRLPPTEEIVLAYTIHGGDKNDNINFCPGFFNLWSLGQRIDEVSKRDVLRDVLDLYRNRATTVAHELLHVSWIGKAMPIYTGWLLDILIPVQGPPRSSRGAYDGLSAKYLAYSDNEPPWQPVNNVQNYVYYMLAQYIIYAKGYYPSGRSWNTNLDPPPPSTAFAMISETEPLLNLQACR